jgi:MoaA/NifB/PqqE/SkfB family radical SAM enzyme
MFMCGNYGDPAASPHTIDIFRYFRQINPNIVIGMNTNGSLRTAGWWTELAKIMTNPMDFVIWSLDGLEDTNHIYRINTVWSKIMENVTAFIAAGGNAQWDMLIYDYNSHQVEQCEQLARSMGFSWFRSKVSSRINNIQWLQPPKGWSVPPKITGPIKCHAMAESSIFVTAKGTVSPCCWLGSEEVPISEFQVIQKSWSTESPYPKCVKICSSQDNASPFTSQWRKQIALK